MVRLLAKTSKTFGEFLLIPGLTTKACRPEVVDLTTPLVKFKKGELPALTLNIPFTSAIMQAVSDDRLAIALARSGGLSFIYASQPIARQMGMVRQVKKFKAGFVISDSNLLPDQTIADVLALKEKTGHTTMAVTADGLAHGQLLGILGSRDYRPDKIDHQVKVREVMTPREKLICGEEGLSLEEANDLIWQHKLNTLPIVDRDNCLVSLVFRKDYDAHHEYQKELIDANKQLLVGAGINTHDYQDRVPALLEAGADILCLDSSDGYSEWQGEAIKLIKKNYPTAKVGAGNVVDGEGFRYLAEAGADFIKVGIGGGSICITREQKGIGRGQASAVIAVAQARNDYFQQTGVYIPICSDGGVAQDYHIALALAMGADWVMLGRYFARFDESPSAKIKINGNYVKEYWGEGSERARNWQRYSDHPLLVNKSAFAEGVDAYVPYAGKLEDNLNLALAKIKSTMVSCGATSIKEFQWQAKITEISSASLRENGAHDVITKDGPDFN